MSVDADEQNLLNGREKAVGDIFPSGFCKCTLIQSSQD